ncbi:probable cellulose synthase A catalytic subunit 8 [UDP-forming] isoform X2 [Ananas comosus]|uniref:Cellulose synthase n=1 Tax=Ananas comosus TaxID=4615 RepID=A0A6P5GAF9_ANACO|nr:probable cellulose synthase A catalytic subunit 8 [UDP-forming] isoform X2 [Ananas comosus]
MDDPIGTEVQDQVCLVCQSWLGLYQGEKLLVACEGCGFPVCGACYVVILKAGSQQCPKCNSLYRRQTGSYPTVDNERQSTADISTSYLSYILDSDNSGSSSTNGGLRSSVNCEVQDITNNSASPTKTSVSIDVPQRRTVQKPQRVYTELPSQFIKAVAFSHHKFCIWSWKKEKIQQQKSTEQKMSSPGRDQETLLEEDDSCYISERELNEIKKHEEFRQPLSRKVPVPSSKISPYRVAVIFRLVALAFFFRYRLLYPVSDAHGLWLTSVICEAWFSFSWLLEQLPKWKPIKRETYTQRLSFRYNLPGEPSEVASIDVFIGTVDPMKEPPLVTSNTVLSILAIDYPVEKVTCYVSDDGGSMLTLETLRETCQFARTWVPFCKKFNIEPRAPEYYFSQKVDYLKHNIFPSFVTERRTMKRQYEEFKVQINGLVEKFQNTPRDCWIMTDGNPWPGTDSQNHPGILQILLGHNVPNDAEEELPQLVYISREKRSGFHDNKMAGAMNSLLRVSALLTNGAYILNLNCNHYVNNSKAFLEAMCFMMDPNIKEKACFVQFPQRFNGGDASDSSNHSTVFYDVNLKGLDGIQGPFFVGTGCFFNRKALYGYDPPMEPKSSILNWYKPVKDKLIDSNDHCASTVDLEANTTDNTEPTTPDIKCTSLFQGLKQYFGQSPTLIASIIVKNATLSMSAAPEDLLKEAITVMSCDYEENTAWGRKIGWIYGSLTSDILTSLKMHVRGWRSIYCTPHRPAFIGTARVNLSDRLTQLLQWALGSMEILFSRHCPIWYAYGSRLKWLERIAYINATIYPLTSIPLVIYCTVPAICLITGKFIIPPISDIRSIWLAVLLISVFTTGLLELRWSGVGTEEWWRSQQFWVIGGVSSHLFAIIYAPVKILLGRKANLTVLTGKFTVDDLKELYALRWTSLLVVPTTIIIINLWAMISGISSAINNEHGSWSLMFIKLFFSFTVIFHLYPFLKGLLVHQQKVPTIVVIWSLLLATIFSMLWVRVNPFVTRFTGPNVEDCGIYC